MRVALYSRVSTTDQSVGMQVAELQEFAARRGWTVAMEESDAGVSGTKDRRPALDRVMRAARERKIDAIVVWKLDRFGRSLKHLVTALADLETLGVTFVSVRDQFDLTTAMGRAMFGMIAVMAEFERELIRERTKAGIAQARRRGKTIGRPRTRVDVSQVARLRAEGLSWTKVAVAIGAPRSVCQRAV